MTCCTALRVASRSEDGMVLVAVIWLLALLGGLAMAMSTFTVNAVSSIDVYNDRHRAAAAVTAGLSEAAAAVMTAADGNPPHSEIIRARSSKASFEAIAETARIDVNAAPAELLAGLFVNLGESPNAAADYASLIVASRGHRTDPAGTPTNVAPLPGADGTVPAGGAAPQSAMPGGATRPTFVDVVQLRQIPGLPSGVVVRAAPFLTTFSGVPQIDPFLAAPEVIEALPGMTRERTRTLLALRDRPEATYDSLSDTLGAAKSFTTATPALATRIKVKADLADGVVTTSEIVIVRFPDDRRPYRVLSWDDDVREAARP